MACLTLYPKAKFCVASHPFWVIRWEYSAFFDVLLWHAFRHVRYVSGEDSTDHY